ncbi:EF-hand domain-containing protein [Variovorax sp. J2P1-59]|uniref:EF-hand domain-containing protein n=1 Tax=Variovorax flavidus TaxID=3053501 RepID=UPI002578CCD0|nr:EF-hand domain-containing protein [Variovorax sp. J2P1-59]MDM0075496.1 EF-hand domain-containing protein [Variovorax sp. J2P1-59]
MKALITAVATAWISFAALAAGGQPSEAEIAAAFKKADRDNGGTVRWAEAANFGILKEAFEHANPDKDGTLDIKEFQAAITYQFDKANPDNDGTLDRKEAAKAGIKSKTIFNEANPDNDGTLDRSEYLRALTLQAR